MRKSKVILISLAGIAGIVYLFFAMRSSAKQGFEDYKHFNSSDVSGIIKEVGVKHHKSYLILSGSNEEYIFDPQTGELNDFEIFNLFAKEGDSVYKPPYSDTLKLIASEGEYLYTFRKPE